MGKSSNNANSKSKKSAVVSTKKLSKNSKLNKETSRNQDKKNSTISQLSSNSKLRNEKINLPSKNDKSTQGSKPLSALQSKFAKKLEGGRFRFINEKLYKSRGEEAFQEFQSEPELFQVYHSGYREQVLSWPENPLDKIITWIKSKHSNAIIADLGCGEARLSESVKNKVYSFDLVSTKKSVIACNIAHTPLQLTSVDIVVFCLSLMGTNIAEFIKEAHRILKPLGLLKITEVRSRFENEANGVKKFLKLLKNAGFDIVFQKCSNTMFFEVECSKSDRMPEFDLSYSAKACVYKKR